MDTEKDKKEELLITPDAPYGWIVVLSAFFCQMMTDGSLYTFGLYLEDMSEDFKVPKSRVSLSSSVQNGVYNIVGFIVSGLINRFGFRLVAIVGCVLTSISFVAMSYAQTLPMLILTHGVLGSISLCLIFMPSIVIIGFYFDKWRALAISIILTGSAMGQIVFPPLFNILLRSYSWRIKFRIIAGAALFTIFFALSFRQPMKKPEASSEPRRTEEVSAKDKCLKCLCCPENIRIFFITMFDVSMLRSGAYCSLLLSAFTSTLGIYIPFLFIIDAAKFEGHIDHNTATYLMTALGAANAVGRFSCGIISVIPQIRPLMLSIISLFMSGIACAVSRFSYNVAFQYINIIIFSLGLAFTAATRPLIVIQIVGLKHCTNAMGLQCVSQGIACLTGITAASFLFEYTKIYFWSFFFSGVVIIISAICLIFVRYFHLKEVEAGTIGM